jgi:hypothetical protein
MFGHDPDRSDRGFHLLVVLAALATGLVMALAFSAPMPVKRDVRDSPDRFAELHFEKQDVPEEESAGPDEGEGKKAKGEEGSARLRRARGERLQDEGLAALLSTTNADAGPSSPPTVGRAHLEKQIAESAGVLAALAYMEADNTVFGAGGIGVGASAYAGGVIGSQYGNQYGSGGLHSRDSNIFGHGSPTLIGEGGGRGDMNTSSLDGGQGGFYGGHALQGTGRRGGAGGGSHLGRKAGAALSIGDGIVLGALERSAIDRVLAQHQTQFRYCFRKELNRQPGLSGAVVTKFVIANDGTVSQAKVKATSLEHPVVENCLTSRLERMKFPSPKGGGIVIAEYRFELDNPQPEQEPQQLPNAGEGVFTHPRGFTADAAPALSHPVREFQARYSTLEDLTLRDPHGYWANTYVPGDPTLRLLRNQLAQFDRDDLHDLAADQPHMEDLARQGSQPFDAPHSAALAVYLHASEPGLEERTRMVVQVGLQGTQRQAGRRPTMNVAVVLDVAADISEQDGACMRALLDALAAERDVADRFSVVVAGRPGGVIVEPDEFRHGPLTVAGQRLFGDAEAGDGPTLDLTQAFAAALDQVGEEESSLLGSNAVVLVTARALDTELDALARAAHEAAVDGVPTSVVGIGGGVQGAQLDRLVLAGQGNRRLMERPDEAADLVQRELTAVGQAVARAVRLRIRLAPEVELVDVLGSLPLDEVAAQQVRDAEQSIDQRVSRDLGIVADRGEDEDGVQVVIPAFYSGDAHVILLDVVVPGPGPVADVTVRYKDLVHLRNGVARDTLDLGRQRVAAGPLERNVTRNVLSHELSGVLREASAALQVNDMPAALSLLQGHLNLVQAVHDEVPGFQGDTDLLADIALLDDYLRALPPGPVRDTPGNTHLIASLRLAGRLKVLPRPRWD